MVGSDVALKQFVTFIVQSDDAAALRELAMSPSLARARFERGATRKMAKTFFLAPIARYVWEGDTALHIAAAAYRTELVQQLISAGADIHARNRLGDQPLHAAVEGQPGSPMWNPREQVSTIALLIKAGADPNSLNKTGVSPLHRAIRSRCAAAVRILLQSGADPALRNKSGSTPMLLATHNTGRGGSGSAEAKAEQQEILRLLEEAGSRS